MFPELADLPTSELKKLLSSDDYALQFLLDNSPLKNLRNSLSELVSATEDLASKFTGRFNGSFEVCPSVAPH